MAFNRKDLDRALEKAVNTKQRAGEWLIHSGGYDRDRTDDGALYVVARTGPYGMVNTRELIYYRPLVNHPDLFLKFARLKLDIPGTIYWSESLAGYPFVFGEYDYEYDYTKLETERNVGVALAWADSNGALGLTPGGSPRRGGEPLRSGGSPMGGEGDTIWRFVVESYIAGRTLRLYEAATDPKGVDIKAIRGLARLTPFGEESPDLARERALDIVARTVEMMVTDRSHPILRRKADGIIQGWGFKDLLGAMWLQMMWLVSADSGRRCKRQECNRAITIERPDPVQLAYTESYRGGKKWLVPRTYATRKDKIYCSNSCKTLAWRESKRQAASSA
jgi:hypothetical protein